MLFLKSSVLGLPQPLTRRQVCPPPPVMGGGAHTLAIPTRGHTLWYSLYTSFVTEGIHSFAGGKDLGEPKIVISWHCMCISRWGVSFTVYVWRLSKCSSVATAFQQFWVYVSHLLKGDRGIFLGFFLYFIQHCFICRPLSFHCVGGCWDQKAATSALAVRRSYHSARSHSQLAASKALASNPLQSCSVERVWEEKRRE